MARIRDWPQRWAAVWFSIRPRGFDGYKEHIGVDPDSEIVTATGVEHVNICDVEAAESLLADLLPGDQDSA
jgi:hypothetical protein